MFDNKGLKINNFIKHHEEISKDLTSIQTTPWGILVFKRRNHKTDSFRQSKIYISKEIVPSAGGSCLRIHYQVLTVFKYMRIDQLIEENTYWIWSNRARELTYQKQIYSYLRKDWSMHDSKINCNFFIPKTTCKHIIS